MEKEATFAGFVVSFCVNRFWGRFGVGWRLAIA